MDSMTENTTIKISLETRTELIKVKGQIEMKEGRKVNYDQAIQELIGFWKKR